MEVRKIRDLKGNPAKNKMVSGGDEGSVCEGIVEGRPLKHALEFKYLRCVLGIVL